MVVRPRCRRVEALEYPLAEVQVVASEAAGDDEWPGCRPGGLAGAVRVELEAVLGSNAALHWENEVGTSRS